MAFRTDILLDDAMDLRIEDGDFVVDESDDQHAELIMLTNRGEWKQWPMIGVDLVSYINAKGNQAQNAITDIKKQLRLDGYLVRKIDTSKGLEDLKIDFELK